MSTARDTATRAGTHRRDQAALDWGVYPDTTLAHVSSGGFLDALEHREL